MRNLAIIALFGFFAGVALRSFFIFGIWFALLAFLIAAVLGIIFWLRRESGIFLIQVALFLAAFGLGALRYDIQDEREDIAVFMPNVGRKIEISGTVINDPQRTAKFSRAVFKSGDIKVLLTLPHYPEIRYGDELKISGTLNEPENFSEFDWKNYLAKDNIYFEMFLPEIIFREEGGGLWLKRALFGAKHSFLANLSRVLPEPHNAFLAGGTIGEGGPVAPEHGKKIF